MWRGRPLAPPAGRATRPTSDKVREAVFDVLQVLQAVHGAPEWAAAHSGGPPRVPPAAANGGGPLAGHRALDLYAGSGGLGIEALSRGARTCTFVERDRAAVAALRRNLATLEVPVTRRSGPHDDAAPAARVVAAPVARALQADARVGCMYTLVLADPPYAGAAGALETLGGLLGAVLAPQAVIVVETSAKEDVALPWREVRVRVYGDTKVTFMVAG